MDEEKPRIMVVEDESVVAKDIEQCLHVLGYNTTEGAVSGEEAVEKAKKFHPDLIVMDIHLKGDMDGIEATRLIGTHLDIPVIYLTAYSDQNIIERAKVTRPSGFINKPFSHKDLRTSIELALYNYRQSNPHKEQPEVPTKEQKDNQLETPVEKLRQSNAELENFALLASHDLQEPLRKIMSFSEMLETKHSPSLSKDGADYLKRIQRSVKRMRTYIDDILAYASLDQVNASYETVDLNLIAHEVIGDLDANNPSTDNTVTVNELPEIEAHPSQMQRLFMNLISNGLKFHKDNESPYVSISSKKISDSFWEISVKDNGIGFDEKFSERIFKPLERLHSATAYEGTGMGLAICKKIVTDHGGKITVTSAPGEGATFIVTLPEKQKISA